MKVAAICFQLRKAVGQGVRAREVHKQVRNISKKHLRVPAMRKLHSQVQPGISEKKRGGRGGGG